MTTVPIKQPRAIAPELVDIGDDIAVEIKDAKSGLTITTRGIVHSIENGGAVNFYTTLEGAIIMRHQPGIKYDRKVTLYGRAENIGETLFSFDNKDVRERIEI